jgi:hypothetical protein
MLGSGAFCRRSGVHHQCRRQAANVPALKIERSRARPQPQAQARRNPDLYHVIVEIDVSVAGQSSTYIFNCIRNGQLTVIQPMGMR